MRIGIFDSGIGGVNVLSCLIKKYPYNKELLIDAYGKKAPVLRYRGFLHGFQYKPYKHMIVSTNWINHE